MQNRKKKIQCGLTAAMVLTLLMLSVGAASASAWWNEKWQYRKTIHFNTAPTGADIKENLTDVPLLVRLHPGNFNFANAKADGEDLRFMAGDDQTLLKYHIERFDGLEEMALIWVQVPKLSGGAEQEFIYLYYGNGEAVGGQDTGGTYDPGYGAVYHFNEPEGIKDVTRYRRNAEDAAVGLGLPSVIGNGVSFNGAGDGFVVKDSPPLDFSAGFTISAWIKIPAPLTDAVILSRMDKGRGLIIGIDDTKLYCKVIQGEGREYVTEKAADLSVQQWNYITVTATSGGLVSVYLDETKTTYMQLPMGLPNFTGDVLVGGLAGEAGQKTNFYTGEMDELHILTRAVTESQVRADYAAMGPDGHLMQFDVETVNEGGGLPLFYIATVVKNISLDGWLIIGILVIMGILSWMVILSKGVFLWLADKDNQAFLAAYRDQEKRTDMNGEITDFENSSIHRVYRAGCAYLKRAMGNPNPTVQLTPSKMNIFKAELEKGLIDETNKMNNYMVMLTMAISGGPFLGLLGTVWGVMNTFAAMAEAGEANIMAIAPGVASALATTVFGLIVAIPALFGYNYLAARIKRITIDITIFVDDFSLQVDEIHGAKS